MVVPHPSPASQIVEAAHDADEPTGCSNRGARMIAVQGRVFEAELNRLKYNKKFGFVLPKNLNVYNPRV